MRYGLAVIAQRLLPAASRRTRLFLAALTWSAAGAGLVLAGLQWLSAARPPLLVLSVAAALAVGWVKGHFVLAPRARANARRIEASGEREMVFRCFAPAAWALVPVMMAAGALLRRSALPRHWLGVLYAAIGTALLVASTAVWGHWRRA